MAANQIQRLSDVHEYILDWLLANPGQPQYLLANSLGYTQAWISTVINSDVFQAKLREAQEERRDLIVLGPSEKLNAVADLALEKTLEKLEVNPSEGFLAQTSSMALKALGYGGNKGSAGEAHKHLHLHVGADELQAARERAQARRPKVIDPKGDSQAERPPSTQELLPEFAV